MEFEPAADTSGLTTEAADPPIGGEEEFLEYDDEVAREAVPAWLNATVFQDRDPPWISARGSRLRSRVPVAESASQFKGTKRSRDPP